MNCPYKINHKNPKHKHFTCSFCNHVFCYALPLAQHAIKRHNGKLRLPVQWKFLL